MEQRLQALRAIDVSTDNPRERRPYPQVFPKYRKSSQSVRDVSGPWEAAALADCTASIREKTRRFPDPTVVWWRAAQNETKP